MEIIQAAKNRTQFQSLHCMKIFTNGTSIFWVGCVCQSLVVQDPHAIHRMVIYRFDVMTKACSLIVQWVPSTKCKYWSFQIVCFAAPKTTYYLLMFQHQRQISVHLIDFTQQQPEAILIECIGWSPWVRGMTITAVDDGPNLLVICHKKNAPNVCIVYKLAIYTMMSHIAHVSWSLYVDNRFALAPILSPHYHKGWDSNEICGKDAVRWAWQKQPTSAVKGGHWSKILLKSSLWTDTAGGLYLWVPPRRTLPFVDESIECTICYNLPTNANELLDNKVWVRPCKCLGYCHQECVDRWALYKHGNDLHWRQNVTSGQQNLFQCHNCHHIYTHTTGPLRPMHQMIQATKALKVKIDFLIIQHVMSTMFLFTMMQATFPIVQSLAQEFFMAALYHFYNVLRTFGQTQWMLPDVFRCLDAMLLLCMVISRADFVLPVISLLLFMAIPVPVRLVGIVYLEMKLLKPHWLALHKARFVDLNKPTPKAKAQTVRRTQSLTNLPTCE